MDKKKTLKKRVWRFEDMPIVELKEGLVFERVDTVKELLDKKRLLGAVKQCLEEDDNAALLDIVKTYVQIFKKHGPVKEKAKPAKKIIQPALRSKRVIIKKPAKNSYSPSIEKRAQTKK
jgi:hypothetical protein